MNRRKEKELSRKNDADRLALGKISATELRLENNWFRNLDLSKFRITRIGKRKFNSDED